MEKSKTTKYIIVLALSSSCACISSQDAVADKRDQVILTNNAIVAQQELLYKNLYGQKYTYDKELPLVTNIKLAAEESFTHGITQGIQDVTKTTLSKALNKFPEAIHGFLVRLGGYAYKLSYGSQGLSWNKLAIFNSRLTTLIVPLTTKSYVNNAKDARANVISQAVDPEYVDENWKGLQDLIIKEIAHVSAELQRALPCYNLTLYSTQRGFMQRGLAHLAHAFSLKDNEQISTAILSTIYELEMLTGYIKECKTFKDAELSMDHIKRWLVLTNNSFVQIGNSLKGAVAVPVIGELQMRVLDQRGGSGAAQTQMNDLFGASNTMNLDALLK